MKIISNEQKRLKALDVTVAMQKLLTPDNYDELKGVADNDDEKDARRDFNTLCNKEHIRGDLRKYLWTLLRDSSIKGAHGIDMDDVPDAPYCWG